MGQFPYRAEECQRVLKDTQLPLSRELHERMRCQPADRQRTRLNLASQSRRLSISMAPKPWPPHLHVAELLNPTLPYPTQLHSQASVCKAPSQSHTCTCRQPCPTSWDAAQGAPLSSRTGAPPDRRCTLRCPSRASRTRARTHGRRRGRCRRGRRTPCLSHSHSKAETKQVRLGLLHIYYLFTAGGPINGWRRRHMQHATVLCTHRVASIDHVYDANHRSVVCGARSSVPVHRTPLQRCDR